MNSRELGPYILLRKLSQSALLETYRAGEREGQEVQRVVLLCFFNVDSDDATWLAGTAQAGRRALKGLDANSLGSAIDSGEIESTPYLAYDYISGGDLHTLIKRSRTQGSPVSLGHALLIIDRVAQALLAAWEHESRALHGFLVPQLVMLSTEGDVQLLGIEVASRLRKLLTNPAIKREMSSYLAPEVVPEGQPSTIDDVFSLGALLYELTTGRVLPQDSPEDLVAAIGEARLTDGSELPDFLVELLESSLAPGPKRSNLKAWQAAIDAEVVSGNHQASAFDLALFLHSVFSDELRADDLPESADDSIELLLPALDRLDALEAGLASSETPAAAEEDAEPEVKIEAVAVADEPPMFEPDPEVETQSETESTPESETESESAEIEPSEAVPESWEVEPPASSNRRPLAIGATIALLALVGFAGFKFFGSTPDPTTRLANANPPAVQPLGENLQPTHATPDESTNDSAADETAGPKFQEPLTPPSGTPGAVTTDPSPQIAAPGSSALTARTLTAPPASDGTKATNTPPETGLASPTEPSSQPVDSEADSEPTSTSRSVDAEPTAMLDQDATLIVEAASEETAEGVSEFQPTLDAMGETPADSGESSDLRPAEIPADDAGPADSAVTRQVDSTPPFDSAPVEGAQELETPVPPTPAPVLPEPVEPEPESTRPEQTESEPEQSEVPAPLEPAVIEGGLVESGPGVVPPSITKAVEPMYPMRARRLKKSASVSIRVLVGETGEVLEVEQVGDEVGDGFDQAALKAARKSVWQPATKDGVPVKMWRTVRIDFEP